MALNPYNLGLFNSGTYLPFNCDIDAITQAASAVVTTSEDHGFVVGNRVQFFIPSDFGMRQLNGKKGLVTAVPADDQIEVDINTIAFDAFSVPVGALQSAQVLGAGDQNYGNFSPGGVPVLPITVPGSYLNERP